MNDSHAPAPAPSLARLMRQAALELAAQPVPPLPPSLLERRPVAPAGSAMAGDHGWSRGLRGQASRWAGVAAGVALIAGATWLVLGAALPERADRSRLATAAGDERFVPIVSTDRWQRLAGEGASPAWLLQAELPREQLAAYGLPYDPGRAAEPVRAEFLINPAGEVLALRVVNRSTSPRP